MNLFSNQLLRMCYVPFLASMFFLSLLLCFIFIPQVSEGATSDLYKDAIAYGADPTGQKDSTTALNKMLEDCGFMRVHRAYIPAGTYLVSSTLNTFPGCAKVIGAGSDKTIIRMVNSSAPILKVFTARSPDHFQVPPYTLGFHALQMGGFTLTRTSVPTSSGNGLELLSYQGLPFVFDIVSENNYYGFRLGPAGIGVAMNLLARENYSDGFRLEGTNPNEATAMKWHLIHVGSVNNDGWGFHAVSQGGGAQTTDIHPWYDVFSYRNTKGGVWIEAPEGADFAGNFGIHDSVFGEDGGDEIRITSRRGPALTMIIDNTHVELAGTSPTGRGSRTPASGTGNGINVYGVNNEHLILSNVTASRNSNHGLSLQSVGDVDLLNVNATNNGRASAGQYAGLLLGQFKTAKITRGQFMGTPPDKSQGIGISVASGKNLSIADSRVEGNVTSGLVIKIDETSAFVSNVTGYSPPPKPTEKTELYQGFVDGNFYHDSPGVTRAAALEVCNSLQSSFPTRSIRCTWGSETLLNTESLTGLYQAYWDGNFYHDIPNTTEKNAREVCDALKPHFVGKKITCKWNGNTFFDQIIE